MSGAPGPPAGTADGPGVRTEVADGVATVTLDRPGKHNALDLAAAQELAAVWRDFRHDREVRAAVITGAGGRAFCTGIDRDAASAVPQPHSPYAVDDPLLTIGPKANDLWIPVIAAVDGMACGGAFYLLNEAEFIIASETSTFFDPHTTYGMVSAYEAMGMAQRMPVGEAARMALMGTAERISAARAHQVGLVSELTAPGSGPDGPLAAAQHCAAVLASYPADAIQGTVRAVWAAKEAARNQAAARAPALIALGNLAPSHQAELFAARPGKGTGAGHRVR